MTMILQLSKFLQTSAMLSKILLLSPDATYLKCSPDKLTPAYRSVIGVAWQHKPLPLQPHPKPTTKIYLQIILATMVSQNYKLYKYNLLAISYIYISFLSKFTLKSGILRRTEVFNGGYPLSSLAPFAFVWGFLRRILSSVVSGRLG